jgi:2-polyprenyl-3-methyl-5-hydroxy-6-metoxy-1,4-benzoquinol methylase
LAPVIGIDEGGRSRGDFDFLIDLLPPLPPRGWSHGFHGSVSANLTAVGLLPLPRNRRERVFDGGGLPPPKPFRILVSFGAEDPAGLSLPAAESLAYAAGKAAEAKGGFPVEITVVAPGPAKDAAPVPAGIRFVKNIPELREHLAEYDLVVTHFGLTAFEALHARLPVFLISPTAYHEKLAANAGFISAGFGPAAAAKLGRQLFLRHSGTGALQLDTGFIKNIAYISEGIALRFGLDEEQTQTLADYLSVAEPFVSPACPVCGASLGKSPVAGRFPERTYRHCGDCGLIFMDRMGPPPIEYAEDYFFSRYKAQYGKTYLEDFPGLKEAGRRRLAHIKALLKRPGKLLDIGCAYGPFLAAARDEGFSPLGLEPAEDAARYVREELGIPCTQGFFPGTADAAENGPFDAVTLWYVIEHFRAPGAVLKEIGAILRSGGVLAFSTPSFTGVSGRKSPASFLRNSPADHWTVWSPRLCKKLLKTYGFAVKKIVVTGHHPERFPVVGGLLKEKKGLLFSFFYLLSRIFRLGDTFELYAVRENSEN